MSPPFPLDDLYADIGEAGLRRLVGYFYSQIPDDPILAPMYPLDDLAGAEERLRNFLAFRLGGPSTYLEQRGHPALRRRHSPFPVTAQARDRWMELMRVALAKSELSPLAAETLEAFFEQVATFLINGPADPQRPAPPSG